MNASFRVARHDDLSTIVTLLADDELGRGREQPADMEAYEQAFAEIAADAGNELLVAEVDGEVVACLQLTFMPSLTRAGSRRAQIEGTRVSRRARGKGVGTALIRYALELAQDRGCRLAQLATDKRRADARRFYESLGFEATHEGMKLSLRER